MTDPKDHNITQLQEAHKQPLTKTQQKIVDDIRRDVSSTIAAWVQTQFHLGNTIPEVWAKLETARDHVSPGSHKSKEKSPAPMPDDGMLETTLPGPIVPMDGGIDDDLHYHEVEVQDSDFDEDDEEPPGIPNHTTDGGN